MKSTELKKFIKEAVREAIQEELKDILLEAVRAPKTQVVTEHSIPQVNLSSKPEITTYHKLLWQFRLLTPGHANVCG